MPFRSMVGWDSLRHVMDLDFMKKGMETQRQGAHAKGKL